MRNKIFTVKIEVITLWLHDLSNDIYSVTLPWAWLSTAYVSVDALPAQWWHWYVINTLRPCSCWTAYKRLYISKRQTVRRQCSRERSFIFWKLFFVWRFDYWKFSSLTVRSACGNPGNILNGRGTFNSTSLSNVHPIWTTVTYFCISGYQLIGVKTRQCRPDGRWSGEGNPVCKSKNVAKHT